MSNAQARKPIFEKARELLNYGLKPKKVSEILKEMGMVATTNTVYGYSKFNTYEEYAKAQTERLRGYKEKKITEKDDLINSIVVAKGEVVTESILAFRIEELTSAIRDLVEVIKNKKTRLF